MRGSIILLVVMFAAASAGTVKCEITCAGAGPSHDAVTPPGSASGAASMHCHGQMAGTARHHSAAPDGNSKENTKRCGVHGHNKIVATAGTKIPFLTSAGVATAVPGGESAAYSALIQKATAFRCDFLPTIRGISFLATGVLRI
jgi:hypothetical protein